MAPTTQQGDSDGGASAQASLFGEQEPGLRACYQAAAQGISISAERVGKPVLRLTLSAAAVARSRGAGDAGRPPTDPDKPLAEALGVSVYAV